MSCDNEQSPSDASAVLETSVEEDNVDLPRPIGTGVGYVSPTIVSPDISAPATKNKFKKNPPVSEVEVVNITNTSELMGNIDIPKTIFSTTESTTMATVDSTPKYSIQNNTSVSNF